MNRIAAGVGLAVLAQFEVVGCSGDCEQRRL